MVGIKDIASRANTSIATVSHVLNDTRHVSPELRARVEKAIDELGYQPNLLARSLRSKRTGIIGLLVSDILNPYFSELARAVQSKAHQADFQVILANTFEDPKAQHDQLEILRSYQLDGLIIAPTAKSSVKSMNLNAYETPVVLINRRLSGSVWPTIYADNVQAAALAAAHFIEAHRSCIALMLTVPGVSHNEDRILGFEQELAQHGLNLDQDLIVYAGLSKENATDVALDLLRRRPDIQGFFCSSDVALLGVLHAANQLQLSIPEDLGLIGSGNTSWANVFRPQLTYITQPTELMGVCAIEILLDLMDLRTSSDIWPPEQPLLEDLLLPTGFVHGQSCGCELPPAVQP